MKNSVRKTLKKDDEETKTSSAQRTRLKTRPLTSTTTSSPIACRRVSRPSASAQLTRTGTAQANTQKKLAATGRGNKSVGPVASRPKKPPVSTPPPRKQEPVRRRTVSSRPLCQRSQQRHEAFRAAFERITIDNGPAEKKKVPTKKPVRPRSGSVAGGSSVPPRLPSVRTSQEPSNETRPRRRRWFPESTPEPQYRPRKVREEVLQQKLRKQIGTSRLHLSPSVTTPHSTLDYTSFSPERCDDFFEKSRSVCKELRRASTKGDPLWGHTPPPAEADADSEQVVLEDDTWGVRQRYATHLRHQDRDRQPFRLKTQEYQYQRMHQYDVQYDTERSPDAIYERMEDDELDLA